MFRQIILFIPKIIVFIGFCIVCLGTVFWMCAYWMAIPLFALFEFNALISYNLMKIQMYYEWLVEAGNLEFRIKECFNKLIKW